MRFIRLNENNKIISIREGETIVDGEIQSDTGDICQIRLIDGTFIEDTTPIEPTDTKPTLEDRLENIENTLDILLLKQEGII